jgi:hypothetical protein
METKWFSKNNSNKIKIKFVSDRETKQASEILYKLLNGLSQSKIKMTPQQQLFCQQVVERVHYFIKY